MTSERQQHSNKMNAQSSTGPVTAAGKAAAAQNAMKHGLSAQPGNIAFWEDPQAYSALQEAIQRDLAPVGAMEMALADRIVQILWRESRINRLELGVLYHAFVNFKGMEGRIPDNTVLPHQSDPAQMTRQDLQQHFDTQLGNAVAYDLSEGRALTQVDGFRFRNHRMLLETLQALQKMQAARQKADDIMALPAEGDENGPAADGR